MMTTNPNAMDASFTSGDDPADGSARADPPAPADPVLLYDGLCGFCDRTVQFVLDRDPGGSLKFAPLQGEFARHVLQDRLDLHAVDSLLYVEPAAGSVSARVLDRSDAAIALAAYLGGWPAALARPSRLVPRFIRDAAYDLFARHRYRLFGRRESCAIPADAVRRRFLD